jgi:hypothetical protein
MYSWVSRDLLTLRFSHCLVLALFICFDLVISPLRSHIWPQLHIGNPTSYHQLPESAMQLRNTSSGESLTVLKIGWIFGDKRIDVAYPLISRIDSAKPSAWCARFKPAVDVGQHKTIRIQQRVSRLRLSKPLLGYCGSSLYMTTQATLQSREPRFHGHHFPELFKTPLQSHMSFVPVTSG